MSADDLRPPDTKIQNLRRYKMSHITFAFIMFIMFIIVGYYLYYLTHKNKFIIPITKKIPKINAKEIIYCERNWICTSCMWSGKYKDTNPVMYHGQDWQNCPSCEAVAIPMER